MKTAGVDESILMFAGPARVFESQDAAVKGILGDKVDAGDVVVIRYEGPRGGPGMQEMLYPTSYLKSKGLGKVCALVTDGRFSGGISGLSIGHVSPEAAEGGADRPGRGRRPHRDRHSQPPHPPRRRRQPRSPSAAPRWKQWGRRTPGNRAEKRSRKVSYGAEGLCRDGDQRRVGRGAAGAVSYEDRHPEVRANGSGPNGRPDDRLREPRRMLARRCVLRGPPAAATSG